ncbi:DUF5686 family protein [Pleomorphovibrio marinus]|uniref:DUF5686 family protein n=1 Tax=Pleomorphovibrio marinus TaxID=2164132 RepID=UPI000E0C5854|nr:DUF5686 and carboxypeptidase regulatory-like domain-containing protein [Pleomorphovibrio marinus]
MRFYWLGLLLLIAFLQPIQGLQAQGVRGKVLNESGESLGFASLYFRNLGEGAAANEKGEFRIQLPEGAHDLYIQHLGYQSLLQPIEVEKNWVELEIVLTEQTYGLKEVTVDSGQEDPALTVMRKAIAKADFHRLQVDSYKMRVYLKGTGTLTKAPIFFRKKLKEEGLNLNEAYTVESLSEIRFSQPNTYEEKVTAIRTIGEDLQTSPAPYITASFYQDKINDILSPLSRIAFAYYRFRYEGSFLEEGLLVNKIKVIPKSRGEKLFEGHLYIIEDLWAIHSLDLVTYYLGFKIEAKQHFSPIEEKVWMPVTHSYRVSGKFFGFAGEFNYLATISDYELSLNPDLAFQPVIVDEKIEPISSRKGGEIDPLTALAEKEQELSRKEFRGLVKDYEKSVNKQRENQDVLRERKYAIDSLATKRGLNFWDSIRPIALTPDEVIGYRRDDSLARVERAKFSEKDSASQEIKRKFKPFDLFNGQEYFFGGGYSAGFYSNGGKFSYNTVEGFKMGLAGFFRYRERTLMADSAHYKTNQWLIRPEIRYGFASNILYGRGRLVHTHTEALKRHRLELEGGRFIFQYNPENPISEWVNAGYSLLLLQNWMKLFEQSYAKINWLHEINPGFSFDIGLSYAQRNHLENATSYSFRNREGMEFTPNQPANLETTDSHFAPHRALIAELGLNWRPGLKYGIRNGRKYPIYHTAPTLSLRYKNAISMVASRGDADFHHLNAGFTHTLRFGVSGKLDINLNTGTFLQANQVYFQDFRHFGGNRTIFSEMGAASNYRFLDYYQYSTREDYLGVILHYQFRKLLFTQLPMLRFSGVRENIFLNYLKTGNSPHYVEIGYGLDNLWRIFRIEVGAAFENGAYLRAGPRLGIATFIRLNVEE